MDDQILGAVPGFIDLYKMIAAAQRAKRSLQPLGILKLPVAGKLRQVKALLPPFPDIHAGRNIMGGFIHPCKVDIPFAQIHRIHAASDVHAHNVRNRLIDNRHGGADGAALTGMNIRHNADL